MKFIIRIKGGQGSGWHAPPKGTHTGSAHTASGSGRSGSGDANKPTTPGYIAGMQAGYGGSMAISDQPVPKWASREAVMTMVRDEQGATAREVREHLYKKYTKVTIEDAQAALNRLEQNGQIKMSMFQRNRQDVYVPSYIHEVRGRPPKGMHARRGR